MDSSRIECDGDAFGVNRGTLCQAVWHPCARTAICDYCGRFVTEMRTPGRGEEVDGRCGPGDGSEPKNLSDLP
ncbi:uncharacterized protein EHS24_006929 [Apiotrichum porosum]|uniref:Uncharacterized protein n=1 Tax=Apiotrichum porosum TaxID=105984 RepID=A0A427XWJ9_9TREE|nr:uncharacterized protein EHS24_006929 [Apiotrichum porosum]RSH83258.1 hypothetical protein EHS24_006929 [Apiotrichum porosum]